MMSRTVIHSHTARLCKVVSECSIVNQGSVLMVSRRGLEKIPGPVLTRDGNQLGIRTT